MTPPYPGRCLCGHVKFQLIADPLTFYVCHCAVCQRRTGGAALPVMWVGKSDLRILEGEPVLQVFDLGNGGQRRSRLCPHCDTRLWAEPLDKPTLAILRPGTLENQGEFEPIAHVFMRSKLPWFSIPQDVAKFDTFPDKEGELIRLWQEKILRHNTV